MPHIRDLKQKFDSLPVSKNNINLYERLLKLDISDFKPLMEEILNGRLDIEDTRTILKNNIPTQTIRNSDPLISTNIADTMKANILSRLFSTDGTNIIKENYLDVTNLDDYRAEIAKTYKDKTGSTLTQEQIEAIMPIVVDEIIQQISLENLGGISAKDKQLLFSDLMSFKPISTI